MKKNKELKVWLIADTHFNHNKLIEYKYRPSDFESKIEKGLKQIKPEDLLIHLGDVCIGNDEEIMSKIDGFILIKGNHDGKSLSWYNRHNILMMYEMVLKVRGKKILFSHKPQPRREGIDFNIHGHTHGNGHRFKEHKDFYDKDYHIEIALEKTNYQPTLLNNIIKMYVK